MLILLTKFSLDPIFDLYFRKLFINIKLLIKKFLGLALYLFNLGLQIIEKYLAIRNKLWTAREYKSVWGLLMDKVNNGNAYVDIRLSNSNPNP